MRSTVGAAARDFRQRVLAHTYDQLHDAEDELRAAGANVAELQCTRNELLQSLQEIRSGD